MSRSLSLYLNLLRFLAAVAVYLFHAQQFAKVRFPVFGNLGDEAVIVFFVLSGLLITFAATRQPDVAAFFRARLARLWSVCLPALALTVLVDLVGQAIALNSYHPLQPYSAFKWVASIAINASFLSQVWGVNVYPGTNLPFWSLSYEFWYYMLFAACFYFKGAVRCLVVACAALIAGPPILIAFPVWLFGAALFYALRRNAISRPATGMLLWSGSIAVALAFFYFDISQILRGALPDIASNVNRDVDFWPRSYALGMLIAANIYGFALTGRAFLRPLERASRVIIWGADISFGLYVFHYPLMYFTRAVLHAAGISSGTVFVGIIYVVPFLISAVLALVCERHKGMYSRVLARCAVEFSKRRSGKIAEPSKTAGEQTP
ncbi:MAG: acyltransferase 3 [Massilia sp.]|nr:acyltransferase 3 [Massilia sp.]